MVSLVGFEPTSLWLQVLHYNHLTTVTVIKKIFIWLHNYELQTQLLLAATSQLMTDPFRDGLCARMHAVDWVRVHNSINSHKVAYYASTTTVLL